MARPMAASAAATVRMNSANTWPVRSPSEAEKATRLMFTDEQDQLDRHQDDDDVLAVEDDAGDADREQDRRDDEVMGEADDHAAIPSDARPRGHFLDLDDIVARARVLLRDLLALDAGPVTQRQHDRADHGGEQHQADAWKKKKYLV